MLCNTFRIDWVFIDSVIIILLFILLFTVRIFKSTHRWRSSFSNEALEYYLSTPMFESVKKQFNFVKKLSLTRNSSLKGKINDKPLIVIFRTNYKRKLLRILTEGLSSYGFNIMSVRIKMNRTLNILETIVINKFTSFIISIIDIYRKKESIINPNYIILSHAKSNFPFKAVLSDVKNAGIVLINPTITFESVRNFSNGINNSHRNTQVYTIFSKKSIFFLKNRNLSCFLKELYSGKTSFMKFYTLDKARNSFKYYETIVLGMLIDIIEHKILHSKF